MAREFRANVILHAEDEDDCRASVYDQFKREPGIVNAPGEILRRIDSPSTQNLEEAALREEVLRIISEIDKEDVPGMVGVGSGQVARALLECFLPAVIISDTIFPMNGKLIVQWLLKHGLEGYSLVGYSGTDFKKLEPEVQGYFESSENMARYFHKPLRDLEEFKVHIAECIKWNIQEYGQGRGCGV
jgi:hypothetical protein